jgi:endonuclease I
MKNIFKQLIVFGLLLISINVFAQIPSGYYDSAEGLEGEDLRNALFLIIKNVNVVSYDDLHDAFEDTDKKSNGKVWDMYSDQPGGTPAYEYSFTPGDQCGNYSGEGSCYNREHSFPKSWFNDASPMYSDLFHLYPTDGYTNGQRSNYPYGEVGSASWTSTNGSKKGSCNYPGYSGVVFEPIDEYKGDFARSYFYMLTCYKDKISNWNSDMLSGSNFSTWARNLLLDWHHDDPVSQKEIDRNNEVYGYQDNRNPFIDNPIWADAIWDPDYMPSFTAISESYFAVYPNPAKDFLEIKQNIILDGQSVVIMSDVSGRVIVESKLENNLQIDLSKFPEGLYIISIINNGKQVYCKKISVIR